MDISYEGIVLKGILIVWNDIRFSMELEVLWADLLCVFLNKLLFKCCSFRYLSLINIFK